MLENNMNITEKFSEINALLLLLSKPAYIINNYYIDEVTEKISKIDFCIYWGNSDAHHKGAEPFISFSIDRAGNATGFDECKEILISLCTENK